MASRLASRPFVTGPGVPQDRVKILQDAFKATLGPPNSWQMLSESENQ